VVLLLVQFTLVVFTPVKCTGIVLLPAHKDWLAVGSIDMEGVGLTVNVAGNEKLAKQPPFVYLALKR
jgi:hypothetical protein